MKTFEANADGLVGPTHNYAGLAKGNIASEANARAISNPRLAALQGLKKMKLLHDLGMPQFIMPPPLRPTSANEPSVAFSASYMWRANAAVVTPSADGGQLHFTPANLITHKHRAQEAPETAALLKQMFPTAQHHAPLPATLPDEGAANHMRLCAGHDAPGVNVFVYGKPGSKYPARQSLEASQAVAKHHNLKQMLFVQQNPEAIDAGVFHNDVIAMSNENLLIVHEKAWVNQKEVLAQVKALLPDLQVIEVTEKDIALPLAVSTYLFNSQLVTLPSGGMALIAPSECEEDKTVFAYAEELKEKTNIKKIVYLNLRESMRNGGGPACLRLRVVLNEKELAEANQRYRYSPALHTQLEAVIKTHYRDRVTPADLADSKFAEEGVNTQKILQTLFS